MSNKLMSIVMLSWNRLHYSKQTLESIIKKTSMPHELILVDNNSSEESGVRQLLGGVRGNEHTQKIVRVYNDKNLGVAGGRNSGLVKASGDYLVTIDDDVIVPNKWDVLLANACDKVHRLGITGINVEPVKYPIKTINGVRVRPKSGNLGGACLCLPRRIFKRVGYYQVYGQYGLEDSDMYVRLWSLGLMSAYIEPHGIHLDEDKDKVYRKVKDRAHIKGSQQLKAFAQAKLKYQQDHKNTYVPYRPYDPDDHQWRFFESFDGTMEATKDLREVLDECPATKGMKIGRDLELWVGHDPNSASSHDRGSAHINTGVEVRSISQNIAIELYLKCQKYNIRITKTNAGNYCNQE